MPLTAPFAARLVQYSAVLCLPQLAKDCEHDVMVLFARLTGQQSGRITEIRNLGRLTHSPPLSRAMQDPSGNSLEVRRGGGGQVCVQHTQGT